MDGLRPLFRIPVREPRAIETEVRGDVILVLLSGEHDASTAEAIREFLSAAAARASGVALSLADVTFIDSSVIHALVIGDRKLREHDRRLGVYAMPGSIADRTLQLCRLNQALVFADTLDEAIRFAEQPVEPASAA